MISNDTKQTIKRSLAKDAVESIHSFLHLGAKSRFKDITAAALGMKSIWEKLVFTDACCLQWQEDGLNTLQRIIAGELTGSSAEEYLQGVNGMFNQTYRDAQNLS